MVLQTIAVDAPAAGGEWSYTVPGRYLLDVVAVYAELDTALPGGAVSMADSSGHGNNGVLTPNPNGPVSATLRKAGPMTNSFGIQFETDTSPPDPSANAGRTSPTTMQWAGDFTIEVWTALDAFNTPNVSFDGGGPPGGVLVTIYADGSIGMARNLDPTAYATVPNVIPRDSAYHLVQCVFTLLGAYKCYVDGVSVAIATQTAVGLRTFMGNSDSGADWAGFNNVYCRSSRLGLYPSALSAGQCAAHYAQGVGAGEPGYTALCIGDGVQLLWAFDDTAVGIERLATLAISDGMNQVGAFPSGAGPIDNLDAQLSWLVNNQSPESGLVGNVVSAPLPRLILPAGYVLESETDNLLVTDQWSGVTIWWDDALQRSTEANFDITYPPGAYLEYQTEGT